MDVEGLWEMRTMSVTFDPSRDGGESQPIAKGQPEEGVVLLKDYRYIVERNSGRVGSGRWSKTADDQLALEPDDFENEWGWSVSSIELHADHLVVTLEAPHDGFYRIRCARLSDPDFDSIAALLEEPS